MKDLKVSKNFYLWEFVPPDIYKKYGESSVWFVDTGLIFLCQFFRDDLDRPININTYKNYADESGFTDSGFRSYRSKVGGVLSQHRFGRGGDLKVDGLDYEELREYVRKNWVKFKAAGLTTIEKNTESWLHIDKRPTNSDKLFEVSYKKKVKKIHAGHTQNV